MCQINLKSYIFVDFCFLREDTLCLFLYAACCILYAIFMTTFQDVLRGFSKEGSLYTSLPDQEVRCHACAHTCRIKPGASGICRVRFNFEGKLLVPSGYVNALNVDPVEKKPFFHVLPGETALSFGMLGCNFHCDFCQNWLSSQALRDPEAYASIREIDSDEIVAIAREHQSPIIVSTYNEPLITSEWAREIFEKARKQKIITGFVSNGFVTRETVDYLRPVMDLFKIDLKSFNPKTYASLGGNLEKVLNGIRLAKEKGFWIEIVTLVVPGFNDSDSELREIARFIVSVSREIPWHVTAFHADYKKTDTASTPRKVLLRAAEIGKAEGLHFVYAGNLPGETQNLKNTYCPQCSELLVERRGFAVLQNKIRSGLCPSCSHAIPGVWASPPPVIPRSPLR